MEALPIHRLTLVALAATKDDRSTSKTMVSVQLGDLEAALTLCRTISNLFFSEEWTEVKVAFGDIKGDVP